MMKLRKTGNKALLSALALAVATPAIVIPMETQTVEAASYEKTFKDITQSHPYYDTINLMANKGVISGYQDGTFRPNDNISRAHAALIMARTLKLDTTNVENPNFKDVPTSHIYYKQIAAIANAGIMSGKENGTFDPNGKITRAQMAVVIANSFDLTGVSDKDFSDVPSENWAYKYVQALADNNVTKGYEDGTFKPNQLLTRAHFVVFTSAALNLSENGTIVTPPIEDEKPEIPTVPSTDYTSYPSDTLSMKNIASNADLTFPKGKTLKQIMDEQAAKKSELYKKNGVTAVLFRSTYEDSDSLAGTLEERIASIAKSIGKSKEETIQLINYAYATGEVYDGGNFVLCYDFLNTGVSYAYNGQHLWE